MSTFNQSEISKILKLKSSISSYYSLQMKKLGDNNLTSHFFSSCIITGGCIASLFHDEAVKDIDLYSKKAKDIVKIKDIITSKPDQIKEFGKYDLDDASVTPGQKAITANAITLTNDVQFIILGEAELCRQAFDFIHCMPWFDISNQKLHISRSQYDAINSKKLIVNPLYRSEIKQRRLEKYINRGWVYDNSSI